MKSKEELFNMTVLELKEYVNSLSNPEIKEVAEIFEDDEHERDPLELLAAPKLFDYMKYANNGTVDIDLSPLIKTHPQPESNDNGWGIFLLKYFR